MFQEANLDEATFDNGSDLRDSDLRGAKLANCCFMGEQLKGARYDDTTVFPAGIGNIKR